jgi:hypothetical protein
MGSVVGITSSVGIMPVVGVEVEVVTGDLLKLR